MNTFLRCTVIAFLFAPLPAPLAQAQAAQTQPAPAPRPAIISSSSQPLSPMPATSAVPAQIVSAHTVYLTNMGGDPNFPIDVTQAYDAIYADLQRWGRYQLVGAPEQADLIFQLHDIAPISGIPGGRGGGYTTTSPAFQLTIVDPKLNLPIYTVTSPVTVPGKGRTRGRWTGIAETNLVSRLKVLANQPLSSAESNNLTTTPSFHSRAVFGWAVAGSLVGLGIAGGFILHHEFENSLASQKASQDAFCNANHIPLSECAGG